MEHHQKWCPITDKKTKTRTKTKESSRRDKVRQEEIEVIFCCTSLENHSWYRGILLLLGIAVPSLKKSREQLTFCIESEGICWCCGPLEAEIKSRNIWIILQIIVNTGKTLKLKMWLFLSSERFQQTARESRSLKILRCESMDRIQVVQISDIVIGCGCECKHRICVKYN